MIGMVWATRTHRSERGGIGGGTRRRKRRRKRFGISAEYEIFFFL